VAELTEHALTCLEDTLGRVDDSDGYMGSVRDRLCELHHEACVVARPDPEELGRKLFVGPCQRVIEAALFPVELGDLDIVIGGRRIASGVLHDPIRRALCRQFPPGVFYVHDGDDVVVLGCLHARRDPTVWKLRCRRYTET
jgi:hypothetical protein